MRRPPSFLARSLEPLINSLWILFLVWTAVVAALWLGVENTVPGIANEGLRAAATIIVKASDTLWLVLAAGNLYLHLAEKEGIARARVVALMIGLTSCAIAACSVWTSYPLGAAFYTTRLGMKLGPVPLGWPLLWFIVVIGGREFAGKLFRRASHQTLALLTGGLALLTAFNMEPIATKLRLYWFWYLPGSHLPSPVLWRNYATWLVLACVLAWFIREQRMVSLRAPSWRPALVLVIVNGIFILGHVRAALMN